MLDNDIDRALELMDAAAERIEKLARSEDGKKIALQVLRTRAHRIIRALDDLGIDVAGIMEMHELATGRRQIYRQWRDDSDLDDTDEPENLEQFLA